MNRLPEDLSRREAHGLAERITALARLHDHEQLLEIEQDPKTEALLALLNDNLRRAVAAHLEGALVWRRQREAVARRRIAEAQEAIDSLDFPMARSLLRRLEQDHIADDDIPKRDDLLLLMEARLMETEELRKATAGLVGKPKKRNWWRRRG